MSPRLHATALTLTILLAGAFGAPLTLNAATSQEGKVKTAKPKKNPPKVTFEKGSGETTSERERRLYRECRGRPNAGACEGFAR